MPLVPLNTSTILKRILQVAVLTWLVLINALYYAQFKALILARFGSWVRR
jgi:hypothetical protein